MPVVTQEDPWTTNNNQVRLHARGALTPEGNFRGARLYCGHDTGAPVVGCAKHPRGNGQYYYWCDNDGALKVMCHGEAPSVEESLDTTATKTSKISPVLAPYYCTVSGLQCPGEHQDSDMHDANVQYASVTESDTWEMQGTTRDGRPWFQNHRSGGLANSVRYLYYSKRAEGFLFTASMPIVTQEDPWTTDNNQVRLHAHGALTPEGIFSGARLYCGHDTGAPADGCTKHPRGNGQYYYWCDNDGAVKVMCHAEASSVEEALDTTTTMTAKASPVLAHVEVAASYEMRIVGLPAQTTPDQLLCTSAFMLATARALEITLGVAEGAVNITTLEIIWPASSDRLRRLEEVALVRVSYVVNVVVEVFATLQMRKVSAAASARAKLQALDMAALLREHRIQFAQADWAEQPPSASSSSNNVPQIMFLAPPTVESVSSAEISYIQVTSMDSSVSKRVEEQPVDGAVDSHSDSSAKIVALFAFGVVALCIFFSFMVFCCIRARKLPQNVVSSSAASANPHGRQNDNVTGVVVGVPLDQHSGQEAAKFQEFAVGVEEHPKASIGGNISAGISAGFPVILQE